MYWRACWWAKIKFEYTFASICVLGPAGVWFIKWKCKTPGLNLMRMLNRSKTGFPSSTAIVWTCLNNRRVCKLQEAKVSRNPGEPQAQSTWVVNLTKTLKGKNNKRLSPQNESHILGKMWARLCSLSGFRARGLHITRSSDLNVNYIIIFYCVCGGQPYRTPRCAQGT